MKLPIGLLATAAVFVPGTATAQQAAAPDTAAVVDHADHGSAADADDAPPKPGTAAGAHEDEDQAIVITGTKRRAGDVLGNVSVLDAEELAHDLKPSIGDTLADLPGVSASSFGPSSSRP